jgi:hypothetical protein
MMIAGLAGAFVLASCAQAQTGGGATTASSASPGFSLTIYSTADPATFDPTAYSGRRPAGYGYYRATPPLPGYGVVRENRPLNLHLGVNTLRFTDVATGIDPTTVSFQSLTAPQAASVLEQNYEYDLVSADKLLAKYLDKPITIIRQGQNGGKADSITGTLLSYDGGNLVVQDESGKVLVLSRGPGISGIELARPDSGLITKPTLVWKIQNSVAGEHIAQVTYQTDGLTWRADYNINLNARDDAADIGAWVTILNQSGAAYPDAHLKLVAGDVQRIRPRQIISQLAGVAKAMRDDKDREGGFAEKSFFEYHLYTLGRTTSLANNSTKQIELFDPKLAVPVVKTFVYYGVPQQLLYWAGSDPRTDANLGTESNKKVDVYLQIRNSEKNGLGIPLPAGRIRVYKTDAADGSREFIGEDVIQHTPKDEDVLVKLGSAFDIVGERKQTAFSVDNDNRFMIESFQIKLRNHKKEPVHVIVKENLYRWTNWEIASSSDAWEKQDYRTIHIPVDVAAGGEKTIDYSVKYTW